jgi:hypothetical protein
MSDRWLVNSGGNYSWNEALAHIDSFTEAPEEPSLFCVECGDRELLKWMDVEKKKLIEKQLCFSCNHWYEVLEDPAAVFAPGEFWGDPSLHAYVIGDEDPSNRWRGFGGRKFVLLFATGARIETTNLWHSGKVPERFVERVKRACPRNAVFVQDGK